MTVTTPPARRPPAVPGTIRVASVPASHVYVRHLQDPDGPDGIVRLDDVEPADGRCVPGGRWPPVMLDGDWIRARHEDFDVFHVHFGFDEKSTGQLQDVVAALAAAGVPLVVTVHDLRTPRHPAPEPHDTLLGILVRAAADVITLTPGAADEIRRRWGRGAVVVPHPHVVEPQRVARPRPSRDDFVVGLHAKSLRANMAAGPVAEVLADLVTTLPRTRLRIDLHDELLDPRNHWYAPDEARALIELGARPAVDVHRHPYFCDDELWDYLEAIDVSVLPYRFGTHSGWLEACHDLGTSVVAPDCGYYDEQQRCHVYRHTADGLDVRSLRSAVVDAHRSWATDRARPGARRVGIEHRLTQRRRIASAHRALYERALARAASSMPAAVPQGS